MPFLHALPDVKQLFEVVAKEKRVIPSIVEKDYWLMHCLWGLQQQGFDFELKGGTSLSKGFNIIERFSEDIDIQIHPGKSANIKTGKNHNKPAHIKGRENFFNTIADQLNIANMQFTRDHNFDEPQKMRSAGIRGEYHSHFSTIDALKPGIVLELGFDQTTPNIPCNISSWALDKALALNIDVIDNRAKQVKCYCPEYTFVEKLQTISTKYRLQQKNKTMPINFLRHYYDVYQLLKQQRVLDFIGTDEYQLHKAKRFRSADEKDISKNEAFLLSDKEILELYAKEFEKKSAIYFGEQPNFSSIINKIKKYSNQI
ncbi:MAG: hypothetical protein COV52_02355 [Gammaproteobacteria bacterium CG11_big_fil_rev_8_21_14_0_20_46_22]|nr:MAG: hypothetical protein COW05_08395 [Gammaproteobacteria bacterium CG12_big_fil_rev_8_21_14_0_65_46_12]PIR11622.1 MAG: hypothetical protein COV52_02355 [Gammaproteobacteria bacterium CG11_big_fil_rev_8_21_14_0_20_46_22]